MTFALVFLSFFAVLLVYLLFRSLFAYLAESELRKCRYVKISTDSVEIFAQGESLEYYLRAALFLGARVTVYVAEGDGESAYIAESMKKYYDFEIIYTN
jgi:hypothetical protein